MTRDVMTRAAMTQVAEPPARWGLVLSCEHGGRRLPDGFAADAPPARAAALGAALDTHRGWDPGALPLARQMAAHLGAPLRYSTISRLVVEPNRSESSPDLFSPWSRDLPEADRQELVRRYHRRHRQRVRRAVEEAAAGAADLPANGAAAPPTPTPAPTPAAAPGAVVHVGVHSFTPILDGVVRPLEVGILLDPGRELERWVAESWARELAAERPDLRILLNEPYDGRSDGLVTTLRGAFAQGIRPGCAYVGLELEVNQGLLGPEGRFPSALGAALSSALSAALSAALTPALATSRGRARATDGVSPVS